MKYNLRKNLNSTKEHEDINCKAIIFKETIDLKKGKFPKEIQHLVGFSKKNKVKNVK